MTFNEDVLSRLSRLESEQKSNKEDIKDIKQDLRDIKLSISQLLDPISTIKADHKAFRELWSNDRILLLDFEKRLKVIEDDKKVASGKTSATLWLWDQVKPYIIPAIIAIIYTQSIK